MPRNRYPALDFDLGSEIEMLRDSVRGFADAEIAPLAAEIDRTDAFPRPLWPKMGRLGLGGLELWRPFQPLRESNSPEWQRGAEAQIPAQADFWRACWRPGDERD